MKKGLFVLFVLLGMLEGMAQEPWSAGRHGAGALVVEVGVGESDGEVGWGFLFFFEVLQ